MSDTPSETERQIRRLTGEYSFIVDKTHEFGDLAQLFTENGVFDSSEVGLPAFEGRDAIRDGFTELDKQVASSFHIVGNHIIKLDGDRASGTCWYYGRGTMVDGRHLDSCGYYDDTYVRTDEGWKFERRILHLLVPVDYEITIDDPAASVT